jgi:TetR/AcrR family hemagglutinin/protease transcriptional regulator
MPEARRRASRLPPDERRRQLVEHAIRVFARRGLERGGHAEVAAAAHVAVPTVFAYFRTRTDLVAAVLDDVMRHFGDMAERHLGGGGHEARALLDFAIAFAASVDEEPDRSGVLLDWSTAVRSEIWPLFLGWHEGIRARIEAVIRRGQEHGTIPRDLDAQNASLILIGEAHLVVQMKFARTPAERVHRFLLALLRAAIGPEAVAAALA